MPSTPCVVARVAVSFRPPELIATPLGRLYSRSLLTLGFADDDPPALLEFHGQPDAARLVRKLFQFEVSSELPENWSSNSVWPPGKLNAGIEDCCTAGAPAGVGDVAADEIGLE